MNYVGVDLHKKTITICVMVVVDGQRKTLLSKKFCCQQPERIRAFFEELGPFQLVVEATASYEWFVQLVETTAERVVLAANTSRAGTPLNDWRNTSSRLCARTYSAVCSVILALCC